MVDCSGAGIGRRGREPIGVSPHSHEGEDVEDGPGLVERVEVDAGSSHVDNVVEEAGAKRGTEGVPGLLVTAVGKGGEDVLGDLDAREVLDST